MYKATVNTLDQVFARYLSNTMGWGLLGYSLMQTETLSQFEDTKRYQVLFRMTNRLSYAVSQLMLTGRAIARGKGLGERIQIFLNELEDLKNKSDNTIPPISSSYVDENDVERPFDTIIKSSGINSSLKLFFIQSVDKKLNIEEMAAAKNVGYNQVLKDLEIPFPPDLFLNIHRYLHFVHF